MKSRLEYYTVKELRALATRLKIVGRWSMTKKELIVALEPRISWADKTRTTKDYLSNVEPGTLVAFKRDLDKPIAMSGKLVGIKDGKVLVETKNGSKFKLDEENIIWVKTGTRWPRWVFAQFNKEDKEADDGLS